MAGLRRRSSTFRRGSAALPDRAGRPVSPLTALLVAALAIRLAIATLPIVHHEDEVWQYLEPAWGRLTGHWIETWDMRAGIRSWLMPALLMPPLALGRMFGQGVMVARAAMGVASLGVVWAFWRIGGRSGRGHAVVAGFVAATWVEIAYFGPRTSSDSLALSLLLPALALIGEPDRRRDGLAGLLAALALMMRLQLAPVLGVALVGLWWRQPGRCRVFAAGLAGGLAIDALANMAMGDWPFAWIWRNVTINLVEDKASSFGTAPPGWYAERLGEGWDLALLLIVPAIVAGARRQPVLLAAGVIEIATMSLIPHKEYRFVTIGVALLVLVAAIGSVDLVMVGQQVMRRRALGWLMAVWLGASALVATGPIFSEYWTQGTSLSLALARAGQVPGLCGIAVYRHPVIPLPAYSLVGRGVPILMIDDWLAAQTRHRPILASAWNVALATGHKADELARGGYTQVSCGASHYPDDPERFCVYVRPGGCTRAPDYFSYNAGLIRQRR
jgi:GPI mannosyltransferase 3